MPWGRWVRYRPGPSWMPISTYSPSCAKPIAPRCVRPVSARSKCCRLGSRARFPRLSRPAMPALKDESVLVRSAAARAIAAAGDVGASTVLIRRLEQEKDEGVLAALLKAIGQLGAKEALDVLAKFAEPGGKPRRTPFVRAAAIEGLARLDRMEAKALLELYARDKEPTVKRAAEASLR